jgi:hypothetical protein
MQEAMVADVMEKNEDSPPQRNENEPPKKKGKSSSKVKKDPALPKVTNIKKRSLTMTPFRPSRLTEAKVCIPLLFN